MDNLYDLRQRTNESLKQYVRKFKETNMAIPDCRDKSTTKAFIRSLSRGSKFYESLKLIKPRSLKNVLERAEDAMEYEEELPHRNT